MRMTWLTTLTARNRCRRKRQWGISLPLLTKMSSERTLAVQAALMQQPDKSLALLAWTLCLNVFGSGAYSKPAQISWNVNIIR